MALQTECTVIYIKGRKKCKRKKKKKKKVANQNGTVDEHGKNTVEKRAQINDQEKIKIKKVMNILNKSKVLQFLHFYQINVTTFL